MKNHIILFVLLICASVSYGQTVPVINEQSTSNSSTLFHYRGILTGDVSIKIPVVDTLNHPATRFIGSLTIRPQDSATLNPVVYMSNGVYWIPFLGGSGSIVSYGKNIGNDSTILIMSDGSRYAASDETGISILSALAPIFYNSATGVISADTTTPRIGLATKFYADSAFVRLLAIDDSTVRFYRKNGDSADISFSLIGGPGGSGSGGIQGLQDVLDVDNVLTKGDTINAYNNLLSVSVTNPDSSGNVPALNLIRNADGTATDGISSSLDFTTQADDGSTYPVSSLQSRWSNAGAGTRTSEFGIMGVDNASPMTDVLTVKGNGQITLNNNYTVGNFAGNFKYQVGIDSAGRLVTSNPTNPPVFTADAPIIYNSVTGNFSLDTTSPRIGVATHFYADSGYVRAVVIAIDTLRFYRKNGDSTDVLYDLHAFRNDSAYVNSYSPNDSTLVLVRDNDTEDTVVFRLGGLGGGGGSSQRFGIEDNTGVQNRQMDMGDYPLYITTGDDGVTQGADFLLDKTSGSFNTGSNGNTANMAVVTDIPNGSHRGFFNITDSVSNQRILNVTPTSTTIQKNLLGVTGTPREIATSVNGNFADPTGNITISTTGALDTTVQWSVLDSLSVPPVAPDSLDLYLAGTSPSGAFTGHANEIATYEGVTGWTFQPASVGDLLYNAKTGYVSKWTGTVWLRLGRMVLHQGGDTYATTVVAGSQDNQAVVIKQNNAQRMIFDTDSIAKINGGLYVNTKTGFSNGTFSVTGSGNVSTFGLRPNNGGSFNNPVWQSGITTDGYTLKIVPGTYTIFSVEHPANIRSYLRAGYGSDVDSGYMGDFNGKLKTIGAAYLSSQYGRVGIGTTSINEAAALDVTSAYQGVKYPSMTSAVRDSMNRGVASVAITNPGSGYLSAPQANFLPSPTGLIATGTTTMVGGSITAVNVTYAGSYNVANATVVIGAPPAGGVQATATVTMTRTRLPNNLTIFCTDCTANDASTGVVQTWQGTSWKNYW